MSAGATRLVADCDFVAVFRDGFLRTRVFDFGTVWAQFKVRPKHIIDQRRKPYRSSGFLVRAVEASFVQML